MRLNVTMLRKHKCYTIILLCGFYAHILTLLWFRSIIHKRFLNRKCFHKLFDGFLCHLNWGTILNILWNFVPKFFGIVVEACLGCLWFRCFRDFLIWICPGCSFIFCCCLMFPFGRIIRGVINFPSFIISKQASYKLRNITNS